MDKISQPLRVLLVEDNPADAELVLRELRRAGFEPDWQRVDTEAEFLRRLDSKIDIILSDYAMPQFSGLRALELVNERGLEIPFIIVSGTIGEETAVASMRSGAVDYLMKDRLLRLGEAVRHALEQKRTREERKRAHEALDHMRYQSELILKSAGEGIFGLDRDGNINFINPKAAELLGWTVAELLGRPAHATIHYKKIDGSTCPLESCPILASMRDGATARVTNDVFWRKNGSSFRVDYVSAPIKDERGQIGGGILTFKDITEQFMAESRQRLQAEQYRLLFETNPNPMWVFDTGSLQILAVNEAAVQQYGYSQKEFLKLTLKDLRPPDGGPDLMKALTFPQSATHFSGKFRHLRKDGRVIEAEVYSGPVVWFGAKARMVTAIDITERRRSDARIREQADIIDRAHDAVIVRDFETDRITVWNNGAERLYGWSASEAIGRPMAELIFAESDNHETLLEQLVSTGEFHGEIKHRAKDGREVIVDARVTLVRDEAGVPRAVLAINTDITEQKKLEMQLLRVQRLESIGTLASGVAHDLNNVLAPILMCSEVLRGNPVREDADAAVSMIEQSARRGASIVKQVLTFARGVEGERVLIQPSHLIEELVDIARRTFPKSIEIRSRYPKNLWPITADPTQLHQVLLNLSVNARDAMPDGGSLVISAENRDVDEHYAAVQAGAQIGPHLMLCVSDTGTGMSQEVIDQMFDPFFTTKEVGKGTGLGLSTVLGIVKSHDGLISVKSEIGKGTTFEILLPATPGNEDLHSPVRATARLQGNGELILVVDDEPSILGVTKLILEGSNYGFIHAKDGPEALATFSEQKDKISVVLTDMTLPRMGGQTLIRELKKIKPDTKFIASSGHEDDLRVPGLEALGVTELLVKPYDTQTLLTTLRHALS